MTEFQGKLIESCDSTNTVVREEAERGAPHGFWVQSRSQTAGRGRNGREWKSLEGNLFLSFLLRDLSLSLYSWVPLLTGIALCEVLEAEGKSVHLEPKLKWPNDVWLNGKKCAGILCESVIASQLDGFIVVGVGVNIEQAPVTVEFESTSLKEVLMGSAPDSIRVRELFLKQFFYRLEDLKSGRISVLENLFWKFSLFQKGDTIFFKSTHTEVVEEAVVSALGTSSELWVSKGANAFPLLHHELVRKMKITSVL